jgi:hypothetical protein
MVRAKRKTRSVSMETRTWEAVEKIARKEHRNVNQQISWFIDRYLSGESRPDSEAVGAGQRTGE